MYSSILKKAAVLSMPLVLGAAAILGTVSPPASAQSICGDAQLLYCHTACVNQNYCGEMCGQCLCSDAGGGSWYTGIFCGMAYECQPYCS